MLIIFKLVVVIRDEEKLNMSRITCEEGGRKVHTKKRRKRARHRRRWGQVHRVFGISL